MSALLPSATHGERGYGKCSSLESIEGGGIDARLTTDHPDYVPPLVLQDFLLEILSNLQCRTAVLCCAQTLIPDTACELQQAALAMKKGECRIIVHIWSYFNYVLAKIPLLRLSKIDL